MEYQKAFDQLVNEGHADPCDFEEFKADVLARPEERITFVDHTGRRAYGSGLDFVIDRWRRRPLTVSAKIEARALEIMAESGIGFPEALGKVQKEDPELAAKYRKQRPVVHTEQIENLEEQ